jgi:hypothetical protein
MFFLIIKSKQQDGEFHSIKHIPTKGMNESAPTNASSMDDLKFPFNPT